jgi:GT2 family glycosyltransferase
MAQVCTCLSGTSDVLVSVVISTYNRCTALPATLAALGRQTIPPEHYEILVVDDGSTDATMEVLSKTSLDCNFRVFRQPENLGVSAGRNVAIREARGRHLVFMSDDLIVPEDFLAVHLDTLRQFPGWWVIGGMRQLDTATETAFGRYLDGLEKSFEEARKVNKIGPGLWELNCPTARNLSLPRADLDRTGLFDEQFRTSCEDQDLAHRARDLGIRFLYNANSQSLHNDHISDLGRCCRQQQRFAHDTVLFCAKRPHIHSAVAFNRVNGYICAGDSRRVVLRKQLKRLMASPPITALVETVIWLVERFSVPDVMLFRLYRTVIGLYIFRGWREGLRSLDQRRGSTDVCSVRRHSHA